ncbi:hypothetical protein [Guptibacillus hwajinpoensis]|uniref:hypothetical protein n=1 Tax=Guptibacillus hwajinpoensis TaxID=208199 RepID=UPI001CFF4341|nr:hypothetical protein [Pseudalkalibacillus hwajinpoensis]WLR61527.1 hypothetical protein LC071_09680 [Pseudalkalibacillus hwajinpoensis]
MEFLAIVCGFIGLSLCFNLFFSFLYLISKSAGRGFYRWVVHDLEFLMVLSTPLIGLTQFVASRIYGRFNWFIARVLLILFSILLFISAIIFFILFGKMAGSK